MSPPPHATNHTIADNHLRVRTSDGSARLDQIHNRNVLFPVYVVCPTADPTTCPADPEPVIYDFNGLASTQTLTEDHFRYNSFNPQLGVNWLPTPTLNLFANLARGARVPSVTELGCAFDATPVPLLDGNGNEIGTQPASPARSHLQPAHNVVG
ncbi:MAG: TonB-dependent receptor [Pseudomonadota bacterium]